MSVVTTPSAAVPDVRATRADVGLRYLVALVCAGSAGVHAALVPEHLRESTALGLAFAASATVLAVVAVAVRGPATDAWAPAAAVLVLLGTATAYVLSRTTGIPALIAVPEPVDGLGVLTSAAELLAAVAAVLLHSRRDHS